MVHLFSDLAGAAKPPSEEQRAREEAQCASWSLGLEGRAPESGGSSVTVPSGPAGLRCPQMQEAAGKEVQVPVSMETIRNVDHGLPALHPPAHVCQENTGPHEDRELSGLTLG